MWICVYGLISSVYKNDLWVECTITKAQVTTNPSSGCRAIRLQLAPDSEANTPLFPSPPSHLTGEWEEDRKAGSVGWNKRIR